MIKIICTSGYHIETKVCRCKKTHYREAACPEGHHHNGWPVDTEGNAFPEDHTKKVCPHCEELVSVQTFRGQVCGFCADMLDEIEERSVTSE